MTSVPRGFGASGAPAAADHYDVVVIGGGAAGMMAAGVAGRRGRRVMIVDHARTPGEKIRISGGGRCNFTNLGAGPENYLSENPHFCRSALSRYTPQDFLELLDRHRVPWGEKHKGQLFCKRDAQDIIDVLVAECRVGNVSWRRPCKVESLERADSGWRVDTSVGAVRAESVVVATGGLSCPKTGATDLGYRIARQFDIPVIEPRPGLVPLTFDASDAPFGGLAGISLEAEVECNAGRFRENLLITHRGLSGPAILQISSFWRPGDAIRLDLLPDVDVAGELIAARRGARRHVAGVVAQWLPRRLAEFLARRAGLEGRPIAGADDKALRELAAGIAAWELKPTGSEGWRKAEVTVGGVDVRALDQRTMMARRRPGLYFVGEVMDVTGWLGGYNFQWAWSSGHAAGMAV